MTLVATGRDFLSVSGFSSEDFGGAHPMNGGTGSVLIDLVRGASEQSRRGPPTDPPGQGTRLSSTPAREAEQETVGLALAGGLRFT